MKFVKSFFQAMTLADFHGLPVVLAALTAGSAILWFLYGGAFLLGMLLLFAAGLYVMMKVALATLEAYRTKGVDAVAHKWARDGATAEEQRARFAEIAALGSAGALAAHSMTPQFNVDGMPMVGNTGVDIYGRVYGDMNSEAFTFDVPVPDAGNGTLLAPADAYSAPIGMDASDPYHH